MSTTVKGYIALALLSVLAVLSGLYAYNGLTSDHDVAPARVHVIEKIIEQPVVEERTKVIEVVPSGDDNGDGHIDEDERGWDAKTMGNGEYTGDRFPNDPTR